MALRRDPPRASGGYEWLPLLLSRALHKVTNAQVMKPYLSSYGHSSFNRLSVRFYYPFQTNRFRKERSESHGYLHLWHQTVTEASRIYYQYQWSWVSTNILLIPTFRPSALHAENATYGTLLSSQLILQIGFFIHLYVLYRLITCRIDPPDQPYKWYIE